MFKYTKILFLIILSNNLFVFAKEDEPLEQIKKGNLSLEGSQQLSPLFGFGQNIMDKETLQLYMYFDYLKGQNKVFSETIQTSIYSIRDDLSVALSIPNASKFKFNNNESSGLEDILLQFEYSLYNKQKIDNTDQITFVANMTFPTGSFHSNPPTGRGSPTFFLGLTASHISINWYNYIAAGTLQTTPFKNIKLGNQYLYQAGLGRYLFANKDWNFSFLLELFGTYTEPDQVNHVREHPEGNILYLGPSLWLASKEFIFQFGIAFVISQSESIRNENKYFIALDFAYTI